MDGSLTLADRVRALPAELFNQIYDETFTPNTKTRKVGSSYNPPAVLQVDKTSRESFARSYYSETTFIFHNRSKMREWLFSLPKHHQALLTKVRIACNIFDKPHWRTRLYRLLQCYGHSRRIRPIRNAAKSLISYQYGLDLLRKLDSQSRLDFDAVQFEVGLAFAGEDDLLIDFFGHDLDHETGRRLQNEG